MRKLIVRMRFWWLQYKCKHSYDKDNPRWTERTTYPNECWHEIKFYDCYKCGKEIIQGTDMNC